MADVSAFDAYAGAAAPDAPAAVPSTPDQGGHGAPGTPPSDEPTYEVTVGGQKQSVPLSELLKGYSRTSDYTRKTQALAQERQTWGQEREQFRQALTEAQQILSNRDVLEQYLRQMGASPAQAAQAAEQMAPDEVLTYAQVQKLLEERERALEQKFTTRQDEGYQKLQVERLSSEYSQAINVKLDDIAAKYPDLPKIPGMDFMLKQAVKAQKPQTVHQALDLMDQAAEYYASQVGELVKARTPAPSAPVRGIEPPRGAAPLPAAPSQFSSVTDPRLRETVIADFQRLLKPDA